VLLEAGAEREEDDRGGPEDRLGLLPGEMFQRNAAGFHGDRE
jgi:hypothetical protein